MGPQGLSDPISRVLIPRMAKEVTAKEVAAAMAARGVVHGYADMDVRIYGDIFPCSARLLVGAVHVTDLDQKPGIFLR